MFGRYHEPLSDAAIVEYVNLARALPNNRISLNTNGDYFSIDIAKALLNAGLSDMNVMLYLANGRRFTDSAVKEEAQRFAARHAMEISSNDCTWSTQCF